MVTMENKRNDKKRYVGICFLLVSSVCIAFALTVKPSDWIMLVALLISCIIYTSLFIDEVEQKYINETFTKNKVNVVSIILIGIAIAFLPDSLGQYMNGFLEFIMYMVSYICWIVGLLLIKLYPR